MATRKQTPLKQWLIDTGYGAASRLARKAKVSKQLVSAVANGDKLFSLAAAKRVARATGLPLDSLPFSERRVNPGK